MHLVGYLRGELVKRQCGDQADDSARHLEGYSHEVGVAERRQFGQPVQAAIDLLEHTVVTQPVERARVDATPDRLCRAEAGRVCPEQLNRQLSRGCVDAQAWKTSHHW